MNLGRIIGSVWATHKLQALKGRRLLLVEALPADGQVVIALDTVDAGTGDVVMIATSSEAAIPFKPGLTPTDATVVGIVERVDGPTGSQRTV